jgi:hypothetical protein
MRRSTSTYISPAELKTKEQLDDTIKIYEKGYRKEVTLKKGKLPINEHGTGGLLNLSVDRGNKRASNWMLGSSDGSQSQSQSFDDDQDDLFKGNNMFLQHLNSIKDKHPNEESNDYTIEKSDLVVPSSSQKNRGTAFTFYDSNNIKNWGRTTTFRPTMDDNEEDDLEFIPPKLKTVDFKMVSNDFELTSHKKSPKKQVKIDSQFDKGADELELTPIKKNPVGRTKNEISSQNVFEIVDNKKAGVKKMETVGKDIKKMDSKKEIVKKVESKKDMCKPDFDSAGLKLDLSQFRAKEKMKHFRNISDASGFLNKSDNNIKKPRFDLDDTMKVSNDKSFDIGGVTQTEATPRSYAKANTKSSYRQMYEDTMTQENDYSYTIPNKLNTTTKSSKTVKEGTSSYMKSYMDKKALEGPGINMSYINKNKKKAVTSNLKVPGKQKPEVYEIGDLDNIHYKKKGDSNARYVLLQKQQKYNKYTDLKKDNKHLDKKEIVYSGIADSQTIDHLEKCVKSARKDASRPSYTKGRRRSASGDEIHTERSFLTKPADESHLFHMLEEIRNRSETIEEHFKDKEIQMTNTIKELKDKLYQHEQNENRLKDEIAGMKYKLAFFIQDYKKKSILLLI